MKRFCSKLTVMLAMTAAAGLAQAPPPQPAPATPEQPAPAPTSGTVVQPASGGTATAGTNTPAPTGTGGPIDPEKYVIGAEDSLQITVWREAQLSGTVPVRPDGMISMVLVGDLRAAGMTPMGLSADISQRLKKYIQDPVVTVSVLGVNSQRIFTVGEVNHVGPLMMTPGMTVLQAIVTAGGLSQFANSKHIYILRTVDGKQTKLPFNYKQALKGENQGISLLPGDTIVVP
jgi:polysaccharide biosynthesis/export protein